MDLLTESVQGWSPGCQVQSWKIAPDTSQAVTPGTPLPPWAGTDRAPMHGVGPESRESGPPPCALRPMKRHQEVCSLQSRKERPPGTGAGWDLTSDFPPPGGTAIDGPTRAYHCRSEPVMGSLLALCHL